MDFNLFRSLFSDISKYSHLVNYDVKLRNDSDHSGFQKRFQRIFEMCLYLSEAFALSPAIESF